MNRLNIIHPTMHLTKAIILFSILILLISSSVVVAQPGFPTGVCGFVNINGIPTDGLSVSITHLASGKTKTYTTRGGGYACGFSASDGDVIRIDCIYDEENFYNTTIVDLSLFEQWLNLSISTDNPPPPPEYTICAYVVDTDTSVAISGATVTCNSESEYSDTSGMACFTVFPDTYAITATKTDYQSDSTTVTVGYSDVFTTLYLTKIDANPLLDDPPEDPPDDGGNNNDDEEPEDPPEDDDDEEEPEIIFYNLTVSVFDKITNSSINNASVTIYDSKLNELTRNCTNESGIIIFQLEEGEYIVEALKDDYSVKRSKVSVTDSSVCIFSLKENQDQNIDNFYTSPDAQEQGFSYAYIGIASVIIVIIIAFVYFYKSQ